MAKLLIEYYYRQSGFVQKVAGIAATIHEEMDRISQTLTQCVKTLAKRYETPLPQGVSQVPELERKITHHLEEMGFTL